MSEDVIGELLRTMVFAIVDDLDSVRITSEPYEDGTLYEITVGKADVGRLIGKDGRVAQALRNVARAAGAKSDQRILVNVMNKPLAE